MLLPTLHFHSKELDKVLQTLKEFWLYKDNVVQDMLIFWQ